MNQLIYMKFKNSLIITCLMITVLGCGESQYSKTVKRELNSGKKYDSLFLTFQFGDQRRAFFSKGWIQNSEGLIKQGPGNQNVEFIMGESKPGSSQIRMLFYPKFTQEDQLHVMDLSFDYLGWSLNNNRFNSDKLMQAVQDTLMSWYGGNDFIKVDMDVEQPSELFVKVDGNRQITLFIKDTQWVEGKIEDLTVKYKDGF